ncbi:MAG: hypothetical protein A3B70_03955 [Deltaproteobacteria bacterium RIFCSPHIGHO2_02_FULL_40_11]|nr:MAG: hypothetical protein A3B70_03955 [Deltaproteobacteria bacterium RIFCSPHIGHO2_02_FULL_40_11]
MILKLHELKKPIHLSVTQKDEWFKDVLSKANLSVLDDFSLDLQLEKDKETVLVQGHVRGNIQMTCSRCAEPMTFLINEFFAPVFVHGQDPDTKDRGLHKSELDVTYFQGDEFSVAQMVQEQLLLSLPIQPLCSESCMGICQHCRKSLNEGKCECKEKIHFGPFHVLKDLKV